MAQKIVTQLVDDIDGRELTDNEGETVTFSLDGSTYEIDLSLKNADNLRGKFQNYIAARRRVGASRSKAKTKRTTDGPTAADIRAWAKDNGHDVPDRGRIPADVREAYETAT